MLLLFSSASLMGGISVAVTTTDNCVHVINTASMREDWSVRSVCVTSRRESVPKRRELKQQLDADAATGKCVICCPSVPVQQACFCLIL